MAAAGHPNNTQELAPLAILQPDATAAIPADDAGGWAAPYDDPDDPLAGDDWWEHIEEPGDPHDMPAEDRRYVEAIEHTRAELGGVPAGDGAPDWVRERFAPIDWPAAYLTDFSQVDWLPGKFIERGQQVALVGDGKVGKSLFALDWSIRMATGRPFLGDQARKPLRVLYVDRENSLRDITTRAQALGASPEDLDRLVYVQFPAFTGALDASREAARELLALTRGYQIDVVTLDTVSRFVDGKENDADTWLQLYRQVHAPLKAAGVAGIRLDHFGKDAERGARGNSAKSQDVDHVWELTAMRSEKTLAEGVETITTALRLSRTHTRSGLGDDQFAIMRRGERKRGGMWLPGRTRHELTEGGIVAQVKGETDRVVQALIDAGCPVAGRDKVKAWMRTHGMPTPNDHAMADIVREFKARSA